MKRLNSAREVIEALGGREAVMELTDATRGAVWNWESYFETFPADCYKVMTDKLSRKKMTAGPHLWRQRGYTKRAA